MPEEKIQTYNEWIEHPLFRFRIQGGNLRVFDRQSSNFVVVSIPHRTINIANWVIDNLKTQSNDKQQSSLLTLEMSRCFKSKNGGLP